MPEVVARVQANPSRAHLHDALVQSLGLPCEVVLHSSDPPNPWQGYLACLTDVPSGVSHLCIVQDDAQVCRNFAAALQLIARDVPVCLYVGSHSSVTAKEIRRTTERYIPIWWREFVPVVAILWPVEKIAEFMDWAPTATLPGEPNPRSDDAVLGYWMRKTKQQFLATVPSLVEHLNVPSTKGVANCEEAPAVLLAEDALQYEW